MGIFEKAKLPAIATVEQNCATGVTAEGKTPKTLVEEMVPLLDSRDVQYVFSYMFSLRVMLRNLTDSDVFRPTNQQAVLALMTMTASSSFSRRRPGGLTS